MEIIKRLGSVQTDNNDRYVLPWYVKGLVLESMGYFSLLHSRVDMDLNIFVVAN